MAVVTKKLITHILHSLCNFISTLVLDQVTKKHEGSYTCKVNSHFGSINMTARLTVLAEPPSFTATGNVHNGQ